MESLSFLQQQENQFLQRLKASWRLLIAFFFFCPFCRWWACKTQSSGIVRVSKWVIFFLNLHSGVAAAAAAVDVVAVVVCVCLTASLTLVSLCSLSNNDLLSLDPYSPNLTAAPASSASLTTGNHWSLLLFLLLGICVKHYTLRSFSDIFQLVLCESCDLTEFCLI